MTSFAFIAGLIALGQSHGPVTNGIRTIGTTAIGGMLQGAVMGTWSFPALLLAGQDCRQGRPIKYEGE